MSIQPHRANLTLDPILCGLEVQPPAELKRVHPAAFACSTKDVMERYRFALWQALEVAEAEALRGTKSLYSALLALENLLMSDILTIDEQEALLRDTTMAGFGPRSWKLFVELELAIEKNLVLLFSNRQTSNLLLKRPANVMNNYLSRFEILVRKEINLARIGPDSDVLMIGSGYFPSTAIELARQVACQVNCVDFVSEAVTTSHGLITSMGLDDHISVQRARGEEIDCGRYHAIIVGCLAQPKQRIMANLAATTRPEARIVCRTTLGTRSFMWKPVQGHELAPYRLTQYFRAIGTQHLSSMLLELDNRE